MDNIEWVDWIAEKKKTILFVLLAVVSVGSLWFYLGKSSSRSSLADYLSVESSISQWIRAEKKDEKQLTKIMHCLERSSSLENRFGLLVAKTLLAEGISPPSFLHEKKISHQEPKKLLAPYAQFAAISLLVGEKRFSDALQASKELQRQIEQSLSFSQEDKEYVSSLSLIYSFNLIRIAFLEKEIGSPPGELLAWEEVERKIIQRKDFLFSSFLCTQEIADLVMESFQEKDISLLHFIQHRKEKLS